MKSRHYILPGFGSHLDVESAAYIGLFPCRLKSRVKILGNAALAGAVNALLDTQQWQQLRNIASVSVHVDLGGNPNLTKTI